jgi:hypothetical protein
MKRKIGGVDPFSKNYSTETLFLKSTDFDIKFPSISGTLTEFRRQRTGTISLGQALRTRKRTRSQSYLKLWRYYCCTLSDSGPPLHFPDQRITDATGSGCTSTLEQKGFISKHTRPGATERNSLSCRPRPDEARPVRASCLLQACRNSGEPPCKTCYYRIFPVRRKFDREQKHLYAFKNSARQSSAWLYPGSGHDDG